MHKKHIGLKKNIKMFWWQKYFKAIRFREADNKIWFWINAIQKFPIDPELHFQLANIYDQNKNWIAAIAEYRTASALSNNINLQILLSLLNVYYKGGWSDIAFSLCNRILRYSQEKKVIREIEKLLSSGSSCGKKSLIHMEHNKYCRLKSISDCILESFPKGDASILDVGGGHGELSLFLPDSSYVIADPNINGISGTALPFGDKSFDIVVSCHVLEHIPFNLREQFLFQLCAKAKEKVLLLNPFRNPFIDDSMRNHLIAEMTDAPWAKEHMLHGLPDLDEIRLFSQKHNFGFKACPNGSLPTTIAMVFSDYYASLAGKTSDLKRVYEYFNSQFYKHNNDEILPTAYLVEIGINYQ